MAIFVCDGRQHLNQTYETLLRGSYLGGKKGRDSDSEKWGFYNVHDFHYPSEIELSRLRAIIIPDSPISVLDEKTNPWITNLLEFIKKVYLKNKSIKLLGI